MFHQGARTVGGNLDQEVQTEVDKVLSEFSEYSTELAVQFKSRLAVVRTRLECNIIVIVDDANISLIAQLSQGMPSSRYLNEPGKKFSIQNLDLVARWDFGFDDYFIVSFPRSLISKTTDARKDELRSIAADYVNREIERYNFMTNLVQVSPIFGSIKFRLDEKLVFVLMPFNDTRTKIYNEIVKPTIESAKLGLVCRRGDEIKSNQAIMQDIWKSICEARIVVADLSDLNPNVMYELGMAHTVGKDTILLYEKNESIKFPFDITHIRRIEYSNEISGARKLQTDLEDTIKNILNNNVEIS